MSKATWGVTVAALAAVGAAVVWQHRDNVALRRDVAQWRTEMRAQLQASAKAVSPAEATGSRAAEAPAKSIDDADLAALRQELAALRKSTQELTQFAQAAQAAAAAKAGGDNSVAAKLTPVESLKNAGRATPEAAMETMLWAATGGDVDTLANALMFTPTAREKADAWFASLSEGTRQQYGSPEKVISLMVARDAAGITGLQMIGQKEVMADNVALRIRFGSADGKTKDDSVLMRRVDDGWRMVVPDNAVEKFARQLHGGK